MALIMISHDLGLAASYADEVIVMYAGRAVEQRADARAVRAACGCPTRGRCWRRSRGWSARRTRCCRSCPAGRRTSSRSPPGCPFEPRCPNAQRRLPGGGAAARRARAGAPVGLLAPVRDRRRSGAMNDERPEPLLEARKLVQEFAVRGRGGVKGGVVHAVSDVSFEVRPGETLGIVGETGSGKSTLARSVLQAPPPKAGSVLFRGTELVGLRGRACWRRAGTCRWCSRTRSARSTRRWRVMRARRGAARRATGSATRASRRRAGARAARPRRAGPRRVRRRRPRASSPAARPARRDRPGDRARPGADHLRRGGLLARRAHPGAGAEPVRAAARRARAVLPVHRARPRAGQAGRPTASASCTWASSSRSDRPRRCTARRATRTRSRCCDSIPSPDPFAPKAKAHAAISGEPPSPVDPPSGCRFRTRCPRAQAVCAAQEPPLATMAGDQQVACHFPVEPGAARH